MTNPKLYALRTSDTGEWVRWDYGKACYGIANVLYCEPYNKDSRVVRWASEHTGHPCEWVEVFVMTAEELERMEREAFEAAIRISSGYATEEDGRYHVTVDDMWNQYKQSEQ